MQILIRESAVAARDATFQGTTTPKGTVVEDLGQASGARVVNLGAYGVAIDMPLADVRATTDLNRSSITDGAVDYRRPAHREEDAGPHLRSPRPAPDRHLSLSGALPHEPYSRLDPPARHQRGWPRPRHWGYENVPSAAYPPSTR
jgi:hypothetical protein